MLALARKYRPRTFAAVAVQSHVSNTLKGAIARGRVAHGYLLCGPRGVGKTTLARVLAMALNCEPRLARAAAGTADDDGEPCGDCASCRRIWSGSASLDVVEIDAASNRGVDDARDLRERAMYAPSGDDRYKVYIVDEAHMLTREAWNALLKVLEEPPPRVVFVFATTEPQKIASAAAPVLSRLQRFDFKRIGPADIRIRLEHVLAAEDVRAEPEALAMIARAADGSMRDALSLTDQVMSLGDGALTALRVREALGLVPEDEYLGILDIIAARRPADVFVAVSRLAEAGVDFGAFLAGLSDMLRAQLAVSLGGAPADLSERLRAELEARRAALTPGDLLRMLSALTELEPQFRKSGQQQLLLETLLVRFALLDRTLALEEVLRGFGGGEASARVAPAAPTEAGARALAALRVSASPAAQRPSPAPDTRPASPPPAASAPAAARVTRDVPAAESKREASATLAAPPRSPASLPELNVLIERWDDVIARVRAAGRPTLAAALEGAVPQAVASTGLLTLRLEESNEPMRQAIESGRAELMSALGELFTGIQRVVVSAPEPGAAPTARRLTTQGVKSERLAGLRKRDPLLDAAVDALDLDLTD